MSSNSIDIKEIRKFGLVALIFFGLLFSLGLWRQKTLICYIFGTLSLLGLGFSLIPSKMIPVYSAWMKIAHSVGKIVTMVILSIAYYLVITPFAIIKRLLSGAPLPAKPDYSISSYWVTRSETVQPKDRFIKRY